MTWTYDTALTADRDKIRLMIGDTDTNDQQFSDEELTYFRTEAGNNRGAALMAVEGLIAKYSRQVDKRVGDLSLSASQRVAQYKALRQTILDREIATAQPFAGGISISSKQTYEDDTDLVRPSFYRTLQENPGVVEDVPDTDDRYDYA